MSTGGSACLAFQCAGTSTCSPRASNSNMFEQALTWRLCRYGFIVMDGNGSLFGALSGNSREVIHKFQVDLPKKHGRGGQSALRFARLRLEKRHNYVRKVSSKAPIHGKMGIWNILIYVLNAWTCIDDWSQCRLQMLKA